MGRVTGNFVWSAEPISQVTAGVSVVDEDSPCQAQSTAGSIWRDWALAVMLAPNIALRTKHGGTGCMKNLGGYDSK